MNTDFKALKDEFIDYTLPIKVHNGPMSSVYSCTHREEGGKVAIKIPSRRFLDREGQKLSTFEKEILITRQISGSKFHPFFIRASTDINLPYMATGFIEGEHLGRRYRTWTQPKELPTDEEATQIYHEILMATELAHKNGVIHRDIKPDNIFQTEEGIVLNDFGLAEIGTLRMYGDRELLHHNKHRGRGGTQIYWAPEIWDPCSSEGFSEVSDVWAASCTGAFLFSGRDLYLVANQLGIEADIRWGQTKLDSIPEPLKPIFQRSMAKDPLSRPDATQARKDLEDYMERQGIPFEQSLWS